MNFIKKAFNALFRRQEPIQPTDLQPLSSVEPPKDAVDRVKVIIQRLIDTDPETSTVRQGVGAESLTDEERNKIVNALLFDTRLWKWSEQSVKEPGPRIQKLENLVRWGSTELWKFNLKATKDN